MSDEIGDDNDNLFSVEKIKFFRDNLSKMSDIDHSTYVERIFNKYPDHKMSSEQAIFVASAIVDYNRASFLKKVMERLTNPHEFIGYIIETKVVKEYQIEDIKREFDLLVMIGVISKKEQSWDELIEAGNKAEDKPKYPEHPRSIYDRQLGTYIATAILVGFLLFVLVFSL